MSIGMALIGLGIGISQGLHTKRQGKKIQRLGEKISKMYYETGEKGKKLFSESLETSKESAKTISKEQKEQAKLQHQFNKDDIKRALEKNIRGALEIYSINQNNLVSEVKKIKGQSAFNDIKNVEESSIKHDINSKISQEALENSRNIMNTQTHDIEEIIHKNYIENYNAGTNFNKTIEGINQNYLVALSNAETQFQRDLGQVINFVNTGDAQGREIQNQGFNMRMQGNQKIASSIMNFGQGMFSAAGGLSGISSKLGIGGNLLGNSGIREVTGIFTPDSSPVNIPSSLKGVM